MTRVFIDSDNISKMAELAIMDLQNGTGSKVYELAGAMDTIADVTDDPIFFMLPQSIGAFAQEVMQFRQLLMLPVLPTPIREKQTAMMNGCIEDVTKQLRIIVVEISKNPCPDHEAFAKAVGSIHKQSAVLHRERSAIMPRRSGSRSRSEDE